jgi:predicted DNA-binding protein
VVGYAVSRMEERINLRLSTEVYRPYERLAQLMTGLGQPTTATGLVRMLVEAQAEQTELVCVAAEAALRGDKEARNAVLDSVLSWNEAHIATARAVEAAERRAADPHPSPTEG